jgi:hypothetical protein
MRRIKVVLWMISIMLLVVGSGLPLMAQDATATPADSTDQTGTLVNCDSSVVLLAGLAHRYFGYNGGPDIDLTTFEFGQYGQLFDRSGMNTDGEEPGASATAEPMATVEPAATAEAMATPVLPAIFLNLPLITGEDPTCGQLRGSLEAFFAVRLAHPDWDARFRSGIRGLPTPNE